MPRTKSLSAVVLKDIKSEATPAVSQFQKVGAETSGQFSNVYFLEIEPGPSLTTPVFAINHYTKQAIFDVEKFSEKLLEKVTLNWQTSGGKIN